MSNTTTIAISKTTLIEIEELVDHRDHDSHTIILDKVIDEFNRMYAILEQNGLVKQLHPEWELSEMEMNGLWLDAINKSLFVKKE